MDTVVNTQYLCELSQKVWNNQYDKGLLCYKYYQHYHYLKLTKKEIFIIFLKEKYRNDDIDSIFQELKRLDRFQYIKKQKHILASFIDNVQKSKKILELDARLTHVLTNSAYRKIQIIDHEINEILKKSGQNIHRLTGIHLT